MIKPAIDLAQITGLLHDLFDQPPTAIQPIGSGQIARVFSFQTTGQVYVIRFVTGEHAPSLAKDQFIADRLAPTGIPVPPVTHTGTFNEFHFAIAPKYPGVQLDQLEKSDYLNLAPAMIENLDQIHQVDIRDTQNYGYFDGYGIGPSAAWPEYLLTAKWNPKYDDSFLDRVFFDHVYDQMNARLQYCPSERYLVHADYGWGNVLAEDGKITAVLDWANALFGDFLYDVAWLDLGSPELDLRARFKRYYQEQNRQIENYEQRIVCYQCHVSLEAQLWYATSDQPKMFEWMRDRTLHLLNRD